MWVFYNKNIVYSSIVICRWKFFKQDCQNRIFYTTIDIRQRSTIQTRSDLYKASSLFREHHLYWTWFWHCSRSQFYTTEKYIRLFFHRSSKFLTIFLSAIVNPSFVYTIQNLFVSQNHQLSRISSCTSNYKYTCLCDKYILFCLILFILYDHSWS